MSEGGREGGRECECVVKFNDLSKFQNSFKILRSHQSLSSTLKLTYPSAYSSIRGRDESTLHIAVAQLFGYMSDDGVVMENKMVLNARKECGLVVPTKVCWLVGWLISCHSWLGVIVVGWLL